MISKSRLDQLTEDELCILLYCMNDGMSGREDEINLHNIQWHTPQFVFNKLNEHLPKIKEQHRSLLQVIADKVTGL
jgi:hypothetical protein